jgi:colanic acid biosynthesis glycosyl transferase WcaI
VSNFVDVDAIRPAERDNAYRAEHGLMGRTVVMYAGNVGFSQSLGLLVHAARAFATARPDVVFVVNGGGAARPALEADAADLPNVRFVDYQPIERLPEVLAAADVHVVPLKRGLAHASVPSKLYSILAAGRPVLASVDPGTEVARTLEQAGAGVGVPPAIPRSPRRWLRCSTTGPSERGWAKRGGRTFASWASPQAATKGLRRLFVAARRSRRAKFGGWGEVGRQYLIAV